MEHANRFSGTTNTRSPSIADALQAAVAQYYAPCTDNPRSIEIELDPRLADTRCDRLASELLDELVHRTLASSPSQAELFFSAWLTSRGIEIELATSGSLPETTPHSAFSPLELYSSPQHEHGRRLHGSRAYALYCARCPQGGQAWTLVLPTRNALARAA